VVISAYSLELPIDFVFIKDALVKYYFSTPPKNCNCQCLKIELSHKNNDQLSDNYRYLHVRKLYKETLPS